MPLHFPRSPSFSSLRADCSKCCALCCVAPSFDAAQGFGFNKAAHVPCANLRGDFQCAIHDDLDRHGFPACAGFDCHGAGQRVTQHLFGGKSWKTSPEIASSMFEAYHRYRALHELMVLLETAVAQVARPDAIRLTNLSQFIDQLCESGAALDRKVRIGELRRDVLAHIHDALRPVIP